MMNRRHALKTLALGATAAAFDLAARGAAPATAQPAAGPAAASPPAGPFTLAPLPYAPDALEPHLDAETMRIHHGKHHAAYVANLNKAVAGRRDLETRTLEDLLRGLDALPEDVRTAVRNHGGGHHNHTLLWTSLAKTGARAPSGELAKAVDAAFGGFGAFQEKFSAAAMSVFGSGWAWLVRDAKGALAIRALPNQDSPLTSGAVPLLGIDVWEHAYYLKFQNRRAEYVAEFAKVVDWDVVSARFRDAAKG
uniref:Superoxide dismutase n=1 Tax=Eiseniibacteriota bacterium TaxID=2212470 RepID=A0A832MLE0_UNCEI